MIDLVHAQDLRQQLFQWRQEGFTIGFVPTMGALHIGHKSLIDRAKAECDKVVCSIFVNPTQFNDPADLAKYPRTPGGDNQILIEAGCDILFQPTVEEMYPEPGLFDIDFGTMETVMEGQFRPGHFRGMATVVSKFFTLMGSCLAYFGEKDFQQLSIVRELARRLHPEVQVVGCETIREADGLAFSSRNIHLTEEERNHSGIIYKSLNDLRSSFRNGMQRDKVTSEATMQIESKAGFRVQYLSVVDSDTLEVDEDYDPSKSQRACIAVLTTRTRLIDNIAI